jgi:hypothetical protein
METFPKDHNSYVNEINKKHDGAAKTLARQLKVWKYKRNVPVSSCYLDRGRGDRAYFGRPE